VLSAFRPGPVANRLTGAIQPFRDMLVAAVQPAARLTGATGLAPGRRYDSPRGSASTPPSGAQAGFRRVGTGAPDRDGTAPGHVAAIRFGFHSQQRTRHLNP
jgi:hypothetical protein